MCPMIKYTSEVSIVKDTNAKTEEMKQLLLLEHPMMDKSAQMSLSAMGPVIAWITLSVSTLS